MLTTSSSFPLITIKDSDKDAEYYKRWVRGIVSNTFTNNWTTSYAILRSLYSFFLSGTGSDMTGWLQTAPDGSQMPGIWASLQTSRTRLIKLKGELEERGYQIKATALNTEALDRKLEEKERLRIRRVLQEVVQEAEKMSGVPLESPEYVPQTEEELAEYMDLDWKDKHVLIIEAILKWIARKYEWDEKRVSGFLDILISNRSIYKVEIVNGIPIPRRVDPLRFIFDPNSTDDMLSDSTYFGEVDYMPLAQAAEMYGLSLDELNECYSTYESYLGLGLDLRGAHPNNMDWCYMPGQSLRWFKLQDGTPRCLVIRACWRDMKTLAHKYERKEKYNVEFLQDVTTEPERDRDKIVYNKIECWRQGTLVGGKFLVEAGECPNQPRDLNKLHKSEAPYKVWIPEFLLGKSVSMAERMQALQLQKDIAAYQIQVQLARQIGKVLVMDEAFLPEGMTREQAMSYIKADGIAWVNSQEYQMTAGGINLFKDYDLALSESIGQLLNIITYYDRQLDDVSGVTEASRGAIIGSSQGMGVTNTALAQSSLVTASLFRGFERHCSRVFNYQAKLAKIAWAGKEVFAPIIGDVGIDFLRDNIDISLDEFDVVVQSLPPATMERQKLEQMVLAVLNSDPEFVDDALEILLEPDMTVAVRKFQRKRQRRRIYMEKQARLQQQTEQQMSEQQMMMQQQSLQDQLNQALQLQQLKNQGNMEKTLATGRVKLNTAKLDLFKQ